MKATPHPIHAMINRRTALKAAAAAAIAAGATVPLVAVSQPAFPNRPITIILPYGAGGSADTVTRMVAERLQAALNQPVVVQNKPGASSTIGLNALNAAPADGHTLFFAASTLTTQAAVNRAFAQSLDKLIPLSETVRGPYLIAANPSVPAATIKELADYSRQNPQALNYGSTGIGSSVHFTVEAFKAATGVKMTHVPYSGSALVLNALLANQVQLMCDPVYLLKPHVEQGKLKAIAVTGSTRSPLLPNVPTVAEVGNPDFDLRFWMGFFLRDGTPEPIVQRLNTALAGVIKEPEMNRKLAAMGFEPVGNTQREFQGRIRTELASWAKVVRDNNLSVD